MTPFPSYFYWLPPVVSVAGSMLGSFIISYLRERGKNYATKADVGHITKIVEEVKSQYSSQQEQLRAQLSTMVNIKNTMHDEMRKAVLEFWDCLMLLKALCDTTRPEIDEERVKELDAFAREIEHVENKLIEKQARLYFLIDDEILTDLSEKLVRDITKIHGQFGLFLSRSRLWLDQLEEMDQGSELNWSKENYEAWWKEIHKLEARFAQETELIEEELEDNIDLFKEKARRILQVN